MLERPLDHPIGDLSLKNDTFLFRGTPYLNTEPVAIVGGGKPKLVSGQPGYGEFLFNLNGAPDAAWQELFYRNVALNRDVEPRFKADCMVLVCEKANLELFFQWINTAIDRANGL